MPEKPQEREEPSGANHPNAPEFVGGKIAESRGIC